jgi:GNAT superfamily N-acetyltransferase
VNRELYEIAEDGWSFLPAGVEVPRCVDRPRRAAAEAIDLVDVAENAFGLVPVLPPAIRESSDELILVDQDGPRDWRMAMRVRFPLDELDARREAVRAWFRERGRDTFTWWVGTASTRGVYDALVERGATPDDDDEYLDAMVLDEEPPPAEGVDVRPVETFEDALVSRRILQAGFETELPNADLRALWEESQRLGRQRAFIAYVDGEPVGRANAIVTEPGPVQLLGGVVLEPYRGRGLYRALVRARWDWAVERGTPILVTQSGHMSRPILTRLGFRTVGRVRVLIDSA